MICFRLITLYSLFFGINKVYAQTIEQKKSMLSSASNQDNPDLYFAEINNRLRENKELICKKHHLATELIKQNAETEKYEKLLNEINKLHDDSFKIEKKWMDYASKKFGTDHKQYMLCSSGAITLSQFVYEYGLGSYVYLIPPEIGVMKLNLGGKLPIPRESWGELLEIILSHNGIGIKHLNAFTRQLYIFKQNLTAVNMVTDSLEAVKDLDQQVRAAFIFSPNPERVDAVVKFLDRIKNPKVTYIFQVGYKVLIISSKQEIEKLTSMYDLIWVKNNEKQTKIIHLEKIDPANMEKILQAYFPHSVKGMKNGLGGLNKVVGDELKIFPLKDQRSIVLIGRNDVVKKAKAIIDEAEKQVEDPSKMAVSWYNCRNSDPEELCSLLDKVYTALIGSRLETEGQNRRKNIAVDQNEVAERESFLQDADSPSNPLSVLDPINTGNEMKKTRDEHSINFIPYPKTGAIMMVVQKDVLPKIKELISKLDIPKQMVQIEVLLFEKRIKNHNNFGLNIFRLGSAASDTKESGLKYETGPSAQNRGIADFFLFRKKTNNFIPSFDIAYNFLMAQEDLQINAAPSVTTLNQTPAQISLVEEISIDNGAAPVNASNGTIAYQQSYSRAQYGTTIVITPTIHDPDFSEDATHFITLETNITFDTIKKNVQNDRPAVSKRHVENNVRVRNGETVILGGLREKTAEDSSSRLPFVGEIPGLGKFFGDSKMTDEKTEMFFFITPKIIFDESNNFKKQRMKTLEKRPGDLPEFISQVELAKAKEKYKTFDNSLKLFFGKVNG